jgi:hypothetical protein
MVCRYVLLLLLSEKTKLLRTHQPPKPEKISQEPLQLKQDFDVRCTKFKTIKFYFITLATDFFENQVFTG